MSRDNSINERGKSIDDEVRSFSVFPKIKFTTAITLLVGGLIAYVLLSPFTNYYSRAMMVPEIKKLDLEYKASSDSAEKAYLLKREELWHHYRENKTKK